ncbi:MAG: hypothetical protein K0M70_12960 [Arenimonas sp.]|uniref:hypothetical protein n=1 Tax=Arenimonas sp. TaxID=1872635 RepID=UPI0025BA34BC|nr:hypothetical protein [Arenimonas sp.]MBW8368754.1 hypothetical protein [Arenimonas sp.]
MTSPNRRPSLEDVLDALFLRDDAPTPEMIVQACQAHTEFREEILEFAALRAAQAALPDVAESELEVSDASVMRLQSHVLNLLYGAPRARADADAVRQALQSLAGQRLKAAAQAIDLGSTVLLHKILTQAIIDTPRVVLVRLAQFLKVGMDGLVEALGPQLALHRSYKAADKPTMVKHESWDQAVAALAVDEAEKARLRAMQDRSDPA